MRFFLDECMNVKVDEPLRQWLKRDEFLRSGPSIPYGLYDISLIQRLEELDVDAVITSDIKQMRSPIVRWNALNAVAVAFIGSECRRVTLKGVLALLSRPQIYFP